MEELRRLPFKGVTHELKYPSNHKQSDGDLPKHRHEEAANRQRQRDCDHRDSQRVAEAVYRMGMTGRILRDPLLVAAFTHHALLLIW